MPNVSGGGSSGLKPLTVADIEACPDRASFLQLVMPYYQQACSEMGIRWPGVCALQCIYETGVPTNIAHSLRANNNMGGLKGTSLPGATVGEKVTDGTGGYYARFESVDKYIYAAIYNIVHSGYYTKALSATNMQDFALFLIRVWVNGSDSGGDAYAWDVIKDYEKYGLASYENDGSGSVVGAAGAMSGTGTDMTSGGIAGLTFETKPVERETARVEEGDHEGLKTFYRVNMSGAQFIKQVLAPYCRAEATGQGGYRLWFDDETNPNGASGVKLYFKPDQYNSIKNTVGDNILENIDKEYQFSFGQGPESSVIDFTPDYTGIVTSLFGGGEVDAATTDALTNELIHVRYGKDSDESRPSTGDSKYDDLQGVYRIGDSSYSVEEIQNRAANLWYNMAFYGYTANMTILGDPLVQVQSLCTVGVYTPMGLPHHSSGVYLIYKATDEIQGGSFTTTLELVRNAVDIGVDDSGGLDITIGSNTNYIGQGASLVGASPMTGSSAVSGSGSGVGAQAANATIQSAIDWAVGIANDDKYGYEWGYRGIGASGYDCSGLVTTAYQQAGVDFGNPSTHTMRVEMLPVGFVEHNDLCRSCENAQPGDVYINESVHTAMYIGNGKIVHAAGNKDGVAGDSSGREILVTDWYDGNWNVVLRYGG